MDITVLNLPMPKRIDAFLTDYCRGEYSRQEMKRFLVDGKVYLNGRPAKPKDLVRENDLIRAELGDSKKPGLSGENIPISVLYEDEFILVVDKPAGLVVHPGAGCKTGTLVHALIGRKTTLADRGGLLRPGIVHRLDKETSGVLLVAKTNKAHRKLQAQFAQRSISKIYWALVQGRIEFEEGHIDKSIGQDPKIRQKKAVSEEPRAREALTRYRVLKRYKHATLLEVKIVTGRTHQIRVHMQHLGHPVLGDALYGPPSAAKEKRLALHAKKIEFLHPETDKITGFESPLPNDFEAMLREAENKASL